ncbi:flavodoxin family protein [Holophaga foetida]|uniref:flavodoxin family protein n=1 Tax=Holophaga foetida TaxID=35839 RepID=UPI0002473EDC|nr:flavodoxin family protein [Holophaga foetida]
MNILVLLGSPRSQGNSATIAAHLAEAATALGAQVRTVELNGLSYRGCQACYACKGKAERCVLQDDLTPVLAAVESADALVLATPVYFGDVTAQLKGFLDRSYGFLAPGYLAGGQKGRLSRKKLVFIQTQGNPDQAFFKEIFPRVNHFLEWMGFADGQIIRACGLGPNRGEAIPESVLAEAEQTAQRLVEGWGLRPSFR